MEKLHGTEIFFAGKSVGATEQAVLTAVSASGKTRIYNCAKEPEIIWLCRFLKKMGASIQGEGTEEILIEGGKIIQGADMQVPPDRIVAGTYLCAAAATEEGLRSRILHRVNSRPSLKYIAQWVDNMNGTVVN